MEPRVAQNDEMFTPKAKAELVKRVTEGCQQFRRWLGAAGEQEDSDN